MESAVRGGVEKVSVYNRKVVVYLWKRFAGASFRGNLVPYVLVFCIGSIFLGSEGVACLLLYRRVGHRCILVDLHPWVRFCRWGARSSCVRFVWMPFHDMVGIGRRIPV